MSKKYILCQKSCHTINMFNHLLFQCKSPRLPCKIRQSLLIIAKILQLSLSFWMLQQGFGSELVWWSQRSCIWNYCSTFLVLNSKILCFLCEVCQLPTNRRLTLLSFCNLLLFGDRHWPVSCHQLLVSASTNCRNFCKCKFNLLKALKNALCHCLCLSPGKHISLC